MFWSKNLAYFKFPIELKPMQPFPFQPMHDSRLIWKIVILDRSVASCHELSKTNSLSSESVKKNRDEASVRWEVNLLTFWYFIIDCNVVIIILGSSNTPTIFKSKSITMNDEHTVLKNIATINPKIMQSFASLSRKGTPMWHFSQS